MKVVMDAVFNHTGRDFFAFKDIIEKEEKIQISGLVFYREISTEG